MSFVRTVDGDVASETLGVVNCHDHLIRVGAGEVYLDADHLLDNVDKAVQEASYFVDASRAWAAGGTVIDMCPAACGRSITKLAEVSARVDGLQIVVATGFHQEKVYLETRTSWVNQYSVNQVADLIIADIVEGVVVHDYMGPLVERSEHKAGVIKFASAYGKITAWEQKTLEAVAIAANETGCPINTHTSAGTAALEQAQAFVKLGVNPEKVSIGHVQRNADVWYLSQITKLGCYVELDGTSRIKYLPDSSRVNLVKGLHELGYGKQILLGTDSGKRSYQKAYGSVTGVDFDPAVFGPRLLDEGFDRAYVEDLLMHNAHRFLEFGPGRQQ